MSEGHIAGDANPPDPADDAAHEAEFIAAGMIGHGDRRAARGIAIGIILSVPVWILLYFILR
ncbi:MAG: hypothetical protein P4L71_04540 [Acetobacteraceae bacterium]|nr:hypothetical protein [Acetobacteraceae bacterium]